MASLMALPQELFNNIVALTFPPFGQYLDETNLIRLRNMIRTNRAFYKTGHSIMHRRNA